MKIQLMALIATVSLTAQAESFDLHCKQNGAGPDSGYAVDISKDGYQATVKEITIAGPQVLAALVCYQPVTSPPPGPDVEYVALKCLEPNTRDAGYSLHVIHGGFAGLTTAELFKVTIAGETPLAALTCSAN